MGFDFGKEIMEGLRAFKDGEMLKNAAFYLVAELAIFAMLVAVFFVVGAATGSFDTFMALVKDETAANLDLGKMYMLIVLMIVSFIVAMVAVALIRAYFAMRFYLRSFSLSGFAKPKKSQSFVDFILMGIRWYLVKLFTWYEKRILAVWAGCYILALIASVLALAFKESGMALPLIVISLGLATIGILVHLIGILYHEFRLELAPLYFLQFGMGARESLLESWRKMEGNVIEMAGITLILGVVQLIIAVPVIFIAFLVGLALPIGDSIISMLAAPFLSILSFKYLAQVYRYFEKKGKAGKPAEK